MKDERGYGGGENESERGDGTAPEEEEPLPPRIQTEKGLKNEGADRVS